MKTTIIAPVLLAVCICVGGCVPKAESDVVVYAALDEEFSAPILAEFERSTDQETGVIAKYDIESTKTVGLVNQIIAEGDPPVCDLFWNNEVMHTIRLQKLGLLQPRKWAVQSGWPTDMIARDGSWCGFAARARVLLINTDLVAERTDYPTSVRDLVNPIWKERCAMARPLFGTTATHFAVLRERDGRSETLEFLKQIQNNALILSGNKQVALAVSSGQVAWGLTDTDDAIIEKDLGRPVAIVFPDQQPDQPGTLRIPNTVAVLKNAPHSVAANLLADHLVRAKTEDRLAMGDSSQLPLSRESEFTPRVLPSDPVRWMKVDFEAAAEDWEKWSAEVLALFP
ncbi:extracellular solute-binding protein [Stieleria varia]|uniref:Iron-utilization periplasmic protein n=1 Tax=Stieleria varia TaxID=2528005 RepID=A0A5C6B871_9BACT|nr:extracellular solute-binding protein [Stieleria varia]TWU07489.1 Iron-utilization periplasmic protein precursor [Stieleria varia]